MARGPKTISPAKAKEIADRYFDLDSGEERPSDDELDHDAGLLGAMPRRRRKKAAAPPREPDPPVTDKQARFIEEYCVDFNGTQAAIRAGYSLKTAAVQAYENLRKPHIARAIDQRMKILAARSDWDAMAVLKRLAAELTADLADIFDEATGALKPVHDWPLIWRQGGVLVGVETQELPADDDGELTNGRVVKVRLVARTKQLEMMGKHQLVQAFNLKKVDDAPKVTPLEELARQLNGTGLRPREITVTARRVDGA